MKAWSQRKFLYINGDLHRKLRTNKTQDIYVAQNTQTGKVMTYSYAVVRETHKMAYTTTEVATMLGRSSRRIRYFIRMGVVSPQKQSKNAYTGSHMTPTGKVTGTGRCEYHMTPEEVHEIRDYMAHSLGPQAGESRAVPSKAQLEALMSQNVVLYVKASDGSFVPTWKAKEY